MFKKAERKQAKLKIALTGPSGSGKTYSALRIATGMVGKDKIAFLDTENKSGSLYSDRFNFFVEEISPPFLTSKYIEHIKDAIDAGFEILIIDSLSHAWAGEGGILSRKTDKDSRGGNSFTNWKDFSKEQEVFLSKILQSDIHIITTMRSKQEYVMSDNGRGKMAPQKVGLAPIQRDGAEYEFTTVLDIQMDHKAEASKDRTGLFSGIFQVTEDTGKTLIDWLNSGIDPDELINTINEMIDMIPLEKNSISAEGYLKKAGKNIDSLKKLVAWCDRKIIEVIE